MDSSAEKGAKDTVEKSSSFDYGTPSQNNVSFSFNLDLENFNEDFYSDSDGELEIDVSEIDNYERQNDRTRIREMDKDISVFNKMEEEIERQLDAKAARTNLTATNVKNILKHVITNEHVMAMVKRKAYNLEDDLIFEPKLTRAKAKELAMSQPNIPWPITPIKKLKGSEVQVLIEQELPEDSSDEEYHPGQDEPSDDERETEGSSVSSDVDSQPATPAPPANQQPVVEEPQLKIVNVRYDEAGVFKIPEARPPATSESENIGQRTRSKLCLSETPLEQIEQAFVPPDITTDMYDWDWDVDEDWNNFLKEFTQPLTQEIIGEDDPEADPEYNILEDEDGDLLDKEELRMDKAVKVTRKELNNLVAELFEFADMFSKEDQDVTKKKRSSDTMNSITENTSINGSVIELLPVLAESNLPKLVSTEQRVLLHVQLCQHIQLVAQHFALTYMHPELHSQAKMCKDNLNSLRYLSNGENSAFNAINLPDALELVSDLETQFKDPKSRQNYIEFLNQEIELGKARLKQKMRYIPKYYPAIKNLLLKGKALIYPQLLPEIPFGHCPKRVKMNTYLKSEDQLIVLGLEQFIPFVSLKQTKFKNEKMKLFDTAQLISQYLVPNKDPSTLFKHINKCRTNQTKNPIQEWYKTEKVPNVIHCIIPVSKNDLKAPLEQPFNRLSVQWQRMFTDIKNPSNEQTQIRLKRIYKDLLKPSQLDTNCNSKAESIPLKRRINHNLLNPTVNMLPAMPFLNTPIKNTGDSDKSKDSIKTPDENLKKWCINSGSQELPNIELFDSPSSSVQSQVTETVKDIGFDMSVKSACHVENICTDTNFSACKQSENISSEIGPSLESNLNMDALKEMEKIHESEDLTVKEQVSPNLQAISSDSRNHLEETKEQVNLPATTDKPQLRTTTPRLAKIRSAQNMKMMAQILGNKSPALSTAGVKPRGKKGGPKNSEEPSTSNNGDNEDEIAELMLASTTIKKDQKRAKQARELENIKRLVEAENNLSQEERATKFAVSFLHKLHKALDPSSEVFKAIIKLFLDYNEQIDTLNGPENEGSCHSKQTRDERSLCAVIAPLGNERPSNSQCIIEGDHFNSTSQVSKDLLTIDLYKDVCEKLVDYPELNSDFLLFLKPHQAAMIGKSVEHTMLQKMNDFVDIAQIYFAKQPSKLSKVMQAITQLATDTDVSLETVNDVMENLLKGHPLVMDTFLQVLPNGKPPESLFAQHMFENLTCPPGPHDKTKTYAEDAPELYENIEIPVSNSHEDPYGGDNCKCECHNLDGHNLKSRSEHCVSCGTRFLNGRIYLQTTEGLRPARITFPGGDDEKQEHIIRVSLKTTEKFVPATPKRRRKSSKNSPDQTDAKANKNSPIKDSEEMDKSSLKSKRMNKISMKSREQKKSPKITEISSRLSSNNNPIEKKESMSPIKTKREERAEKREAQDISRSKRTKVAYKNTVKSSKILDSENTDNATQSQTDDTSQDENSIPDCGKVHDIEEESKMSTNEYETEETVRLEKMEVSSDSGSEPEHEIRNAVDIRPWTRQEDAILLECIKKEYSENTFLTISETLGDRTVQQVKERFEILLSLLEKMA
ncbi:GON-4-like protein [Neodiprion fabricii]|uniref:GON-4-like protein n=1 Tax=Neodiprion fabricii TaxID=2872261 RepID=UPI001ED93D4A|nr:GON-4-like protein [Neodiprion fabricii]XP_046423903.1 GON-4-like protein [Neodiprion fabricii]